MRFYYFDFSLLDPTRLLKNLGKSFSGGRPGSGGCVGDRGGRELHFWELGEGWAGARSGKAGEAQQGLEEGTRARLGRSGVEKLWGHRVTSIHFDLGLIICK